VLAESKAFGGSCESVLLTSWFLPTLSGHRYLSQQRISVHSDGVSWEVSIQHRQPVDCRPCKNPGWCVPSGHRTGPL